MKKLAVNITLKKIVFALPWFFRVLKIRKMAKNYKSNPETYSEKFRYNYLLKLCEKILRIYNIDLEVLGYENIEKGYGFIVPNHKSGIDPIVLIAALKNPSQEEGAENKFATFISKEEQNKILIKAMSLIDVVLIKRNDLRNSYEGLINFGNYVKNKKVYGVIFPEGTRVKGEALGEFKSGAFKIAKSNYLPIIPCAISNSADAFNSNRKKRLKVTVSFLSPLKPQSFMILENEAISNRVKELISKELHKNAN